MEGAGDKVYLKHWASVSRSRLSFLETFEPFILDCSIFHLNSLGLCCEHHQEMDFSVPGQKGPRRPQCLDIPLVLDRHALGAL